LSNLRIGGPYVVSVTYLGYTTETVDGIILQLGEKRDLDVQLREDGQTLDEVVVSANRNSVINSERTGASTQIGSAELQRLPSISRSASDFTRLTPSSDGNSFGGRNDQYNNFTLDGSVFNNPFGLDEATAGGQANAQPVSLDAIEQIQVNLAPYDVTQSGFTGAGVNAVTKSGSNEFHGTVYGFFRNQDLTGSKVGGEDIFVPELSQIQTGASIGGPIIKNKLFFFANFELERREDLGSNFLASRPGLSGEQVSRVEASDLEMISSALNSRFDYQTGAYENYLHNTDNEKGLIKLDWNVAPGHTVTATYNFLNASRDLPANRFALGRRGPDAQTLQFFNSGYTINNKINSGILEWNGILSDKLSNKLQVGFSEYEDFRSPFSTPFPSLIIQRDGTNYIVVGHEPFSINNRLDQNVFQFTNNTQYFVGKHTFTAGVSFERFSFDNSFNLGTYPGVFGFGPPDTPENIGLSSPDNFVTAINNGVFDGAVAGAQETFNNLNGPGNGYNGQGWSLAETNVGQLGLYLQDEISLNENFTLTLGLRLDRPLYFDTDEKIAENLERACCENFEIGYFDEDNNAVQLDSRNLPSTAFLVNPRVGF
ncbi:MAG: TonB-dependent receptor, partial [Bacteroidota bacterium]